MGAAHIHQALQLLQTQAYTCRIVGRIHNDRLGTRSHRRLQRLGTESKAGIRIALNDHRNAARMFYLSFIRREVRGEEHHLVTRIHHSV